MPALRGSLTYARFFVDGAPPDDFRDRFVKAIRLRAMKPLDPDEDLPERSGWCRIGEPFETEIGYEDAFYNEYLNLGFRTDRWAIPGPVMRAKMREAEAAYLTKKGRDRLSRREKSELKTLVARKLRKQIAPATRVVDFSWALGEGVVRFFSQASRTGLAMGDLFQKTFGLRLVPEAPYTLAARIGLSKADDAAWPGLEAIEIAPDAAMTGEV